MDRPTEFASKLKKPSFFKVLVNDFSSHLQIPETFVKKYGKYVPNKSVLLVSPGKHWKVDVEKVGKRFYFRKGLEKFVEDNSLEIGDFLIFKYSGNSTYKVKMYGNTLCEKEVHVARDRNSEPVFGKERKRQENDQRKRKWGEIEEGFYVIEEKSKFDGNLNESEGLKGAGKNGSEFAEAKVDKGKVIHIDSDSSDDDQNGELKQPILKQRMKPCVIQDTASNQKIGKRTTLFPNTAIEFNSLYPYFQVTLANSYVSNGYLCIPPTFCREHIKGEDREITLQMLKNIWTVMMRIFCRSDDKSKIEAKLSAGWGTFVRDNGLKVGDVCIFEMIRSDDIVFRVRIDRYKQVENEIDGNLNHCEDLEESAWEVTNIDFDSSDDDQNGAGELKQSMRKRRVEAHVSHDTMSMKKGGKSTTSSPDAAVEFNSQYPSFQVELGYAYVDGYLNIPLTFFRKHMKKESQEIKLQVSENVWTLKVHVYYRMRSAKASKMEARITGGWKGFVRENGLKVGDVCIFEMIKNNDIVFRVHVDRCKQVENEIDGNLNHCEDLEDAAREVTNIDFESSDDDQNGKLKQSMCKRRVEAHVSHDTMSMKKGGKSTTLSPDAAVEFNSRYPSFQVELGYAYVDGYMNIPLTFFRKHMKKESQEIKLQVSENVWTLKVHVYYRMRSAKASKMEARITGGWKGFVRENGLKVGDVCIFEMIKNNDIVFRVHVDRCKQVENEIDGNLNHCEDLEDAAREVTNIDFESSDDDQNGKLKQSMCKRRVEAHVSHDTMSMKKGGKSTTLSPDAAVEFNSRYPSFQVELGYAYADVYLNIPLTFFRKHMKEESQEIKLQISKNIWTLNVHVYYRMRSAKGSSMEARISGGWRRFVRDNGLKVGDVCIFEIIKSDDIVFRVHIDRCERVENGIDGNLNHGEESEGARDGTELDEAEVGQFNFNNTIL